VPARRAAWPGRADGTPLRSQQTSGQMSGQPGSSSIEQPDYWWYRARADLLHSALGVRVPSPRRLLDVGSADAPSLGWLRGDFERYSLDIDPRGLVAGEGICGSATALPFKDGAFDAVSAFDVVEHCDDEVAAMSELARVLSPDGRLMISVPAYQWAWTDHDVANGHHRRYTRERAVTALASAGFEVLRATYGFTGVFPAFAAERVVRAVRHRLSRGHEGPADVVDVPDVGPGLERILLGLCRWDARMLAHRDLPFGSSVFLAAVKPA
jgi:SAM-dependent methyltransferase